MKSILSLGEYVKRLPKKKRELFLRLYSVNESIGILKIPEEMKPWVKKTFGSIEAVEKQRIMRVDNNITCDTALYNELRAKRPLDTQSTDDAKKVIKESKGGSFCNPLNHTPEDFFGRIKGKKSVTASNIAKYGAYHGLVIFNEHNPLKFTKKELEDHIDTAEKWMEKVYEKEPERKYPFMMWNCLWKAGASIVHGHMQIIMGRNKHYGMIERIKKFRDGYKKVFKSDYFEDLYQTHESVGLGFKDKDNKVLVHLTPRKEKEVIIIAKTLKHASETLYKTLKAYKQMGVTSFNVGIYLPPMDNSWDMPIIVRLVDRGSLTNKTTDIASMEIFAGATVVSSDPFKVIENLKKKF